MKNNRKHTNTKKKKYHKPQIFSEEILEKQVLQCNKIANSDCELNPPTST